MPNGQSQTVDTRGWRNGIRAGVRAVFALTHPGMAWRWLLRKDLMWLDMEGMELAALKAAGPVLGTVRAVCMEVSREQSRPGAPCYPEVVSWMRAQGFQPVIDRVSLWFGNILFARPGARTRLRRGQEW